MTSKLRVYAQTCIPTKGNNRKQIDSLDKKAKNNSEQLEYEENDEIKNETSQNDTSINKFPQSKKCKIVK